MLVWLIAFTKIMMFAANNRFAKKRSLLNNALESTFSFMANGEIKIAARRNLPKTTVIGDSFATVNLTSGVLVPPNKASNRIINSVIEKGGRGRVCSWDFCFCAR